MWFWIIGGLIVWALVALAVGVVVGRGIRLADARAGLAPAGAVEPRTARRRIPLPPLGVGLAAAAVLLEATGYVTHLTGASGTAARVLSMDAPYSMPRAFVAALFAAAAVAALAGAARIPGRRTWWAAVGVVAGAIALVKAGSTVHAEGMSRLSGAIGPINATVVSAAIAGGALAVLAFVSRAERRDRRRVLGCLAAYALASVGLSAVSTVVAEQWVLPATFLEESMEALAGVAFLVAVLVGVAPRLVLPASWRLRRVADEATLDVPERLPGIARG
ncbi:hypothetical protein [Geodermatophilus sp. CPCC 206100]|uniref:hypothetical protein n=1 Tax=Geodermatophilus sp. CPCC 206100 TaxID=3020054 RepID=UPI003AFF7237